ncbi:nicotinate-nucleotide adenylyltransferase [Ekhidna lutea]|uniref:Probable nicotinate-nucleotide adenylyltransferase n=1 Tax=Ekhidna lutea TaxID=447679 RepID=A0A239JB48_EKHLU|nr:nicotinate (nicotinamide) nucleotide adenylyltransferase [Ekhidna lutea]SNT02708.1 nicotinate-nucleotide adenylyltransferase [Ekhidna lutea]
MEVGLFFGSFNPIHTGHMIIANLVKETTSVEEVWFIVSPQNPFKKNKNLLHEFDRLDLVNAAIADDYKFRSSDVEFNMPRPSYTIDTLTVLQEKHPDKTFRLIIGGDNLASFPKWKNHDKILEHFGLIVYPRPNAKPTDLINHKSIQMIDAPEVDISATLIRKLIKEGKSINYLVPEPVAGLIRSKGFFQD